MELLYCGMTFLCTSVSYVPLVGLLTVVVVSNIFCCCTGYHDYPGVYYRPSTELRAGNVFICVGLSVCVYAHMGSPCDH